MVLGITLAVITPGTTVHQDYLGKKTKTFFKQKVGRSVSVNYLRAGQTRMHSEQAEEAVIKAL
jgi:hypothetical protein